MSTPIFEITPDDHAQVEWPLCRLVIEINRHHLHFVILNKRNKVVALKLYQYAVDDTGDIAGLLQDIVQEDSILQQQMKDTVIIYNWMESAFVPEAYFDINLNKDILDLTYGDAGKGIIFSENIHGWNLYNVYRIPADIHEFFQHYFPGCKYWHHYSLWLKCRQQRNDRHDRVSVIFYPGEIVTSVIAGGQLQVMQTSAYETGHDVLWHVLNIYRRFELDQQQTPLYLSGMIDPGAEVYLDLLAYFPVVVSDNMPPAFAESGSPVYCPASFFSPLLNLAPCVS